MAKTIVSGNLNTFGNAGQFETDRSTWGFADSSFINFFRSSAQQSAGLYSCRCFNLQFSSPPYTIVGLAQARFPAVAGKKYVAKVKAFVPSAQPITDGARVLDIALSSFATLVEQTNKTIDEATDAWVDVEIYFSVHTTPPFDAGHITISARITGAPETLANPQGFIYLDQFEVYEYIDEEDPDVCDLDLDELSTTVTNETSEGAANGQIEVEVTGTGSYEFSKDDGDNYQPSNLFTGLTTDIFIVKVRDTGIAGCEDRWPFAVNHAAVTHDFNVVITHESISGSNDGSITLNPTGTGGPFDFTIDAGETFQGSNNFPGLAPGTYFVAVRNAAGNSVVKVVTVNAGLVEVDKVYHSKNPITLQQNAAVGWELLTNYRLYDEVRVEDVADSGTYNTKLRMELPPDSEGKATFYLPEAFRDCFQFIPPSLGLSTIQRLTDRIKRFKNFTGDLQDTETDPGALAESLPSLVLWGGIDKLHFPDLQFFTTYLQANKKFLTWAPMAKYVDRNQEDYLNFFVYGNFTTLKLQVKAYFDDATTQTAVTKTKTGTFFSQLYQIPAGPVNSGATLVDPEKNVVQYELTLLNQADEVISETRTFYIDGIHHPLTRFIMFLNSLGGFEVLRFTGQAIQKSTIQKEAMQKFLPHNYAALDGEFEVNNALLERRTNYSSGHISGLMADQWHEYLIDLLLSPRVYDVTDGRRIPVMVATANHEDEDQNYVRFIRFDAQKAYSDDSFTPSAI